jgi:hypothetical protein
VNRQSIGDDSATKSDDGGPGETKNDGQEQHSSSSPLSPTQDIISIDTRTIVAHRRRTHIALTICFQNFLAMFQVVGGMTGNDIGALRFAYENSEDDNTNILAQLNEKQRLFWRLRNVDWATLLEESCRVGGEKMCADFRYRAVLLDALLFETSHHKLAFVNNWKKAKMDLTSTHKEWDSRESLMNGLTQMVYTFDKSLGREASMSQYRRIAHLTMNVKIRLRISYECLESAYRRAENRLTKEALAKFEIRHDLQQQGLGDTFCIICQSPLLVVDDDNTLEDEEAGCCFYKLPCSHYFHQDCVQQWLHNHSSCPVCRHDLVDDAK